MNSRLFSSKSARLPSPHRLSPPARLDVLKADRTFCFKIQTGLDVDTLLTYRARYGDDGLRHYCADHHVRPATPDAIFQVRADIFVPAGRTDVLATAPELERVRRDENPDAHDVAQFLAATGVNTIVEAANHPLSDDAEYWLHSEGVKILPDFIVNCGGLIGCWAEWQARLTAERPDLVAVAANAREQITRTATHNIREIEMARIAKPSAVVLLGLAHTPQERVVRAPERAMPAYCRPLREFQRLFRRVGFEFQPESSIETAFGPHSDVRIENCLAIKRRVKTVSQPARGGAA